MIHNDAQVGVYSASVWFMNWCASEIGVVCHRMNAVLRLMNRDSTSRISCRAVILKAPLAGTSDRCP